MIKKLILLAVALCVLPWSMASAAPTFNTVMSNSTDAITIDSQHTGDWENIDSLIFTTSDSARCLVTVSGTVEMDPADVLYIGFGTASDTFDLCLDTIIFKYPRAARPGKLTMPFVAQYIFTAGDGATTDTLYVNGACGGNSPSEAVGLTDVVLSVDVGDL